MVGVGHGPDPSGNAVVVNSYFSGIWKNMVEIIWDRIWGLEMRPDAKGVYGSGLTHRI